MRLLHEGQIMLGKVDGKYMIAREEPSGKVPYHISENLFDYQLAL